jgi:hypothetical protein
LGSLDKYFFTHTHTHTHTFSPFIVDINYHHSLPLQILTSILFELCEFCCNCLICYQKIFGQRNLIHRSFGAMKRKKCWKEVSFMVRRDFRFSFFIFFISSNMNSNSETHSLTFSLNVIHKIIEIECWVILKNKKTNIMKSSKKDSSKYNIVVFTFLFVFEVSAYIECICEFFLIVDFLFSF